MCACCGEDLGVAYSWAAAAGNTTGNQQLCRPCSLAPPAFVQAVAYGGYHGQLRSLVHLLKYSAMRPVAGGLGKLLADGIETFAAAADMPQPLLVIPVPMHAAKQRQRGFNHAELLARAAVSTLRSRHPGWRLRVETNLLTRVRATESQAGLSTLQRRRNLSAAFAVPAAQRLAGQHVLLIDDIYTTGATARACSRVLRNAGAASVRVATVARAQREGVAQWDPGFLQNEAVH